MRFIDSIEPAGREEVVCIQVAAEDSLYVTQDYLLTHNTLNDASSSSTRPRTRTPSR